ncbi:sporulation and cell division repeat protein [Acetobacteraceae bacterium H6797]|nr:sporulation and cell division repeat protein [Acetobacteraceae bacterium H6797]
MRRYALPLLLCATLGLGLSACQRRPQVPDQPVRYMLGEPYQMGGTWSYPREDFALVETGLATVIPDARPGRRTVDNEIYDPGALVAAHRTLQLPAVVRVTNLENGTEILVRVNDRGPAQPGRVLAVSRRAATLLGMREGSATRIRLAVEEGPSRALAQGGQLQSDQPRLQVATAPRGMVESEDLAPPPGAREGVRRGVTSSRPAVAGPIEAAPAEVVPLRLPEQVWQGPAGGPSRLWIDTSTFTTRDAAQRFAARLPGARIEPIGGGRRPEYRVRRGPYLSVPEVDQALEQTMRMGVSEARVVVDY